MKNLNRRDFLSMSIAAAAGAMLPFGGKALASTARSADSHFMPVLQDVLQDVPGIFHNNLDRLSAARRCLMMEEVPPGHLYMTENVKHYGKSTAVAFTSFSSVPMIENHFEECIFIKPNIDMASVIGVPFAISQKFEWDGRRETKLDSCREAILKTIDQENFLLEKLLDTVSHEEGAINHPWHPVPVHRSPRHANLLTANGSPFFNPIHIAQDWASPKKRDYPLRFIKRILTNNDGLRWLENHKIVRQRKPAHRLAQPTWEIEQRTYAATTYRPIDVVIWNRPGNRIYALQDYEHVGMIAFRQDITVLGCTTNINDPDKYIMYYEASWVAHPGGVFHFDF